MQLYLNDTSPVARLVLVTALEAGVEDLQLCWVDPWASPESLTELNPFAAVPTLKPDTGKAIFESLFICQYLLGQCRKNTIVKLSDADDLHRLSMGKALMEMMLRCVISQRFDAQAENSDLYKRSKTGIGRALAVIDEAFQAPPENGTSGFTMADLYLALAVSYVRSKMPDLFKEKATSSTLAKVERWEKRRAFELTTPQALKAKPATLAALRG
ncbi:MAG: glutathione S-transferase [Proteobacteria bacterium]|nr:glutathione S-transferase [Pseudomonadota bacterium]